ncbi:hypothetical protein [Serratia sp. D1N4]
MSELTRWLPAVMAEVYVQMLRFEFTYLDKAFTTFGSHHHNVCCHLVYLLLRKLRS